MTAGLQARFEAQSALLRDALAGLGADARIGELAGEYCAGAHSINLGGRIKVVGIAQRAIRHGALTTAVIVVGGGGRLRARRRRGLRARSASTWIPRPRARSTTSCPA